MPHDAAATRIRRGLTIPLALLVAWEVSSRTGLVDPRFLPSLGRLAEAAWSEAVAGRLLRDLGTSLARDLAGFGIGSALGAAFGFLLGVSRAAERLLGPSFHAAKQVAVLAWIPIISVWFGFAEAAKIVFVALAASSRSR